MNPTVHAARLGLNRGWREFRQTLFSSDQWFNVIVAVILVTVLFFQRGSMTEASLSRAMVTLPSMLGMLVALGGTVGTAGQLSTNREDGTLLRAKAVPHGMVGYLVARVVQIALDALPSLLIVLIPSLFVVPALAGTGVAGWLTLLWVLALGLLATLPWGAIIGSVAKTSHAAFGFTMLPFMGLSAISGIFYSMSAVSGWVQGVAQVFPVYWLGLGMRSALLPDAAAAAEIGQSWRTLETVGVLGAWAVVGFLVAPVVLRRMARRESGSVMQQRHERAMQRVG